MADLNQPMLYRRITRYAEGGFAVSDSWDARVWDDWVDDLLEWSRQPGIETVELYTAAVDWGRDLAPPVSRILKRREEAPDGT